MKILYIALIGGGIFVLIWLNKIRIYLKWQKEKRIRAGIYLNWCEKRQKYEKPFLRWPAALHQEPGQKERLRQAKEEKFLIQYENETKGLCRIKGESDPEMYWCNPGMCQCPDYKKTHKPCKHIYKIALERNLIQ